MRRKLHLGALMRPISIRQLAAKAGRHAGLAFVGTVATIADAIEQWLAARGSDGFDVIFPHVPGGVEDFTAKIVPGLPCRGLFRTDHHGSTLRDHLGPSRPTNGFFAG